MTLTSWRDFLRHCVEYRRYHFVDPDLFDATIIRTWRSGKWPESDDGFNLWFGTALHNTLRSITRERSHYQTPLSYAPRDLVDVTRRLQRLTPEEQQLFWEHVVDGISLNRLARERGLSLSTLHHRYQKILERLQADIVPMGHVD